jgi:hypothetical protein
VAHEVADTAHVAVAGIGAVPTLAAENAAMGKQVFGPAELLWHELLRPDGLLDLRRAIVRRDGWALDER